MFWFKKNTDIDVKYDKKVIIIGGGLSGLISGIHCLSKGMDVTIIEKSDQYGGKLNLFDYDNYPFIIYEKTKYYNLLNEMGINIDKETKYKSANLEEKFDDFVDFLYDNAVNDEKEIGVFLKQIKQKMNYKNIDKYYNTISIKNYLQEFNSKVIKNKLSILIPCNLTVNCLIEFIAKYYKDEIIVLNTRNLADIKYKYRYLGGKYLFRKEVKKINFDKKNHAESVLLDDESVIDADYIISSIDPKLTISSLLKNRFSHIIDHLYGDYINKQIDTRLILMFAINKEFEYNNINVLIDELRINTTIVNYITFRKSTDNNYIFCEINQNYNDYDFLKVLINKDKIYQDNIKKIINEVINIFNNNFRGYKIRFEKIITSLDVEKEFNCYRGMFSGFLETETNKKIYCSCKIKHLNNVFLCSPVLLFDGGIVNSLIIGKHCVKEIEEEIKYEKKEKV